MNRLIFRNAIGVELHDTEIIIGGRVHNLDNDNNYKTDYFESINKILAAIDNNSVLHIKIFWKRGTSEMSYSGSYSVWWEPTKKENE